MMSPGLNSNLYILRWNFIFLHLAKMSLAVCLSIYLSWQDWGWNSEPHAYLKVLYPTAWAIPSSFLCWLFWDRVSYVPASLDLKASCLCFPCSWSDRHTLLHPTVGWDEV
jgi:hypothetical protein